MPTYDYKCEACDEVFEIVRDMNDDTPPLCGKCEGPAVRHWGSTFSFALKGKGFYANDYGRLHRRKK